MRIFTGLVVFTLVSPSPAPAAVYRCELDSGQLSYQQVPCHAGSKPMKLDPRRSGWSALRPGEQAMLDSYREKSAGRKSRPGRVKAPAIDAESCWKKRKQLEEVRATLRRGYPLKDSGRLHRQQDNFRDYLRLFCSRR